MGHGGGIKLEFRAPETHQYLEVLLTIPVEGLLGI